MEYDDDNDSTSTEQEMKQRYANMMAAPTPTAAAAVTPVLQAKSELPSIEGLLFINLSYPHAPSGSHGTKEKKERFPLIHAGHKTAPHGTKDYAHPPAAGGGDADDDGGTSTSSNSDDDEPAPEPPTTTTQPEFIPMDEFLAARAQPLGQYAASHAYTKELRSLFKVPAEQAAFDRVVELHALDFATALSADSDEAVQEVLEQVVDTAAKEAPSMAAVAQTSLNESWWRRCFGRKKKKKSSSKEGEDAAIPSWRAYRDQAQADADVGLDRSVFQKIKGLFRRGKTALMGPRKAYTLAPYSGSGPSTDAQRAAAFLLTGAGDYGEMEEMREGKFSAILHRQGKGTKELYTSKARVSVERYRHGDQHILDVYLVSGKERLPKSSFLNVGAGLRVTGAQLDLYLDGGRSFAVKAGITDVLASDAKLADRLWVGRKNSEMGEMKPEAVIFLFDEDRDALNQVLLKVGVLWTPAQLKMEAALRASITALANFVTEGSQGALALEGAEAVIRRYAQLDRRSGSAETRAVASVMIAQLLQDAPRTTTTLAQGHHRLIAMDAAVGAATSAMSVGEVTQAAEYLNAHLQAVACRPDSADEVGDRFAEALEEALAEAPADVQMRALDLLSQLLEATTALMLTQDEARDRVSTLWQQQQGQDVAARLFSWRV